MLDTSNAVRCEWCGIEPSEDIEIHCLLDMGEPYVGISPHEVLLCDSCYQAHKNQCYPHYNEVYEPLIEGEQDYVGWN